MTATAKAKPLIEKLPRKLLCFESFPIPQELQDHMASAGWDVHRVSRADQIPALSKDFDFRVGIACIDGQGFGDKAIPLGRFIPARSSMRWIAILKSDELDKPSICRLVANRFEDYHTLPVDPQRLVNSLGHTLGMAELASRSARIADSLMLRQGLMGSSPAVQQVIAQMKKAARTDLPVLLRGEIGSGKSTAAELIHHWSSQHESPFVRVHCAFLEKTGTIGDGERTSQFAAEIAKAAGGTLFIDNVQELAPNRQAQLLQLIEKMTPGATGLQQPLRVIASTPGEDVEGLSPTLALRLNVIAINLPPLRERRSDIEPLARKIIADCAADAGVPSPGLSKRAVQALEHHNWTGNVRELTNCIQRAILMAEDGEIRTEDLGLSIANDSGNLQTLEGARAFAEREAILCALTRTDGNVTRAAGELAVSRASLHRLIHKHSIKY